MTCGAPILRRDLVPMFSWLFLRGKCRNCGARISARYFIVESLTGILFLLTFIKFDVIDVGFIYPAIFCLFLASVVVVGFEDFDTQEMSLSVLLVSGGIAALSLVYTNFLSNVSENGYAPKLFDSLIGLAAVSVPILLIGFVITPLVYSIFLSEDHKLKRKFTKRLSHDTLTAAERTKLEKLLSEAADRIKERGAVFGFGMGDVVIMAAAGLMLGYKAVVAGTFFAIIFAAVFGIIKVKRDEKRESEYSNAFAFGPFLCIGIAIGAFLGNNIWNLYFSQMQA
jgi:leader peptidase (prepilin peptidase)/N-methyltransferase